MELVILNDAFNDNLEVLEIVENGIPRRIYDRPDLFHKFDDLSFFKRFRLTKGTVLQLLPLIEEHIEFPYDRNNCVSPMNQLLVTLRFYSTGNHQLSVADFGVMHVSTVCRIIKRVSEAIARLLPMYVKFPTTPEEIRRTQNEFYNKASFPRVIGVVDGTHVRIQSPGGGDPEIYRNRKNYFSINVQAVCNANLEITNLVARWPGSCHDATIFNNCNLKFEFENGMHPNCLLLGDSAYNMRPYLFTPLQNPMTEAEQLYNESHIRTRAFIEKLFGIWKRRFPILAYGCRLQVQRLLTIIVATGVLHNIARRMGEVEPPLPDEVEAHVLQQLIQNGQIPNLPDGNAPAIIGPQIRREFINNYFAHL